MGGLSTDDLLKEEGEGGKRGEREAKGNKEGQRGEKENQRVRYNGKRDEVRERKQGRSKRDMIVLCMSVEGEGRGKRRRGCKGRRRGIERKERRKK